MRMIVDIKDSEGDLKLCWFGNPSISEDIEKDLDAKCFAQQQSIFTKFIKNKELMCSLENNIKHLSFYSEKDYAEMNKNYRSNRKAILNQLQLFEDSSIGINILNNIANNNTKNIKTFSYIKNINDAMFAYAVFEIDFMLGIANIKIKNNIVKSIKFRDPTEIKELILNKIKSSSKKKRGRSKKSI